MAFQTIMKPASERPTLPYFCLERAFSRSWERTTSTQKGGGGKKVFSQTTPTHQRYLDRDGLFTNEYRIPDLRKLLSTVLLKPPGSLKVCQTTKLALKQCGAECQTKQLGANELAPK
ncbi:hypothetical protein I7I51_01447 [Histoplasma capsulatum]|uniref:Uncharacterized protein n=1 Tax=Ajellomyces capsulatus TaxID=5037 RepID=A0A8A1MGW7_AJECA|nr:hypothetical protein I7I51_01447 [Histoplasma capsulatum]